MQFFHRHYEGPHANDHVVMLRGNVGPVIERIDADKATIEDRVQDLLLSNDFFLLRKSSYAIIDIFRYKMKPDKDQPAFYTYVFAYQVHPPAQTIGKQEEEGDDSIVCYMECADTSVRTCKKGQVPKCDEGILTCFAPGGQ